MGENLRKIIYAADVGGTNIKFGAFDTECKLLGKWERPTDKSDSCGHIVSQVWNEMKSDAAGRGCGILAVGMGVPGIVDAAGKLRPCANLKGFEGFPGKELKELSGCPAAFLNDANAAALGELNFGTGKGAGSAIFVTLGTGIGGAVILNGQLITGAHGAAGEIGHMKAGDSESSPDFESLARAALQNPEELSPEELFGRAKLGGAAEALHCEAYAKALGRGLAAAASVFDPEIFVLGGGISKAGDYLLNLIRENYKRFAFSDAVFTPIVLSSLGNDAGIFGCAKAARDLARGLA